MNENELFPSITALGAKLFGVSEEKFSDWKWQLKNQVRTRKEALAVLELTEDEEKAFSEVGAIFNIGISPYLMSLMASRQKKGEDITALKLQLIPRLAELSDANGKKDPLEESANSPVKEVVQAYPDRVAFCVSNLCPVYCRYCFRKRRDEEEA